MSPGPDNIQGIFCQTFKDEIIPLLESFQEIEMEIKLQNLFHEVSITLIPNPKTSSKREIQTIILDEQGCQNSQQDPSQYNPTVH